jgi:hypothetical protein
MEDQAMDYEAEDQLQKLEERLGMRPAAEEAATPETVTVSQGDPAAAAAESEAEKELAELEKRIQGNNQS